MTGYQVLVIPWFQGLADSIFGFSLKTARTYQYTIPHKNIQFGTGVQLIMIVPHSRGNNIQAFVIEIHRKVICRKKMTLYVEAGNINYSMY